MASEATLQELAERIAIARRNINELMEQAAAASGAASEDRLAARLNDQQDILNQLLKEQADLEAAGKA